MTFRAHPSENTFWRQLSKDSRAATTHFSPDGEQPVAISTFAGMSGALALKKPCDFYCEVDDSGSWGASRSRRDRNARCMCDSTVWMEMSRTVAISRYVKPCCRLSLKTCLRRFGSWSTALRTACRNCLWSSRLSGGCEVESPS